MREVSTIAAQGDLMVRRVAAIPAEADPIPADDGRHIVAHSETGHHHYLDARHVQRFRDPANELVSYLQIDSPHADLIHGRSYDTHETLRLARGVYEVRRQREYTPEGWRRVED